MPSYVVGVDGGGSRTRLAIADQDGTVLGRGTSGSSNHDDVPPAKVAESLESALQEAQAEANLATGQHYASVFLGMAGVVSERDRHRIRAIVARTGLANSSILDIDHDIRIALAGGLGGRPGLVLIAGTGSACYGRTAKGRSWQAGGWGHLLADEGSGYWLGIQGLRTAMRMLDRRMPESPLASKVLDELGVDSLEHVMHRIYVDGVDRSSIAALAPLVLDLAEQGEAACTALVEKGAAELVDCANAVASELGFASAGFEITFAGGILEHVPLMREAVSARLTTDLPTARQVEPERSPVVGACLLALANLGAN